MQYDEAQGTEHQSTIFSLWQNTFIPQRQKLVASDTEILNFAQFSDCIVFYGTEPKNLVDLVCYFYGWNFSWGVPVRGGLGYGQIFHSDSFQTLGAAIMINGKGHIDACETEQSGKGCGMRLFVSPSFLEEARSLNLPFRDACCGRVEYPWWLNCGHDKKYFLERSRDWWTKKHVGKWFAGTQRTDTERLFELAAAEL